MNIILLTHQRERFKKTNTGSLVADILSEQARIVVWDRVKPDAELLKHVSEDSIALLYPSDDSLMATEAEDYKHYIIIDGTWQEARKIYNQSPYLKNIPTVKISTTKTSAYHLRRNQREGGLCTAECAIELLNTKGFSSLAEELHSVFLERIATKNK